VVWASEAGYQQDSYSKALAKPPAASSLLFGICRLWTHQTMQKRMPPHGAQEHRPH